MSHKFIIFCILLTWAVPGFSPASGPDVGGGISSGPGLSGSPENKESEGYPSGPRKFYFPGDRPDREYVPYPYIQQEPGNTPEKGPAQGGYGN